MVNARHPNLAFEEYYGAALRKCMAKHNPPTWEGACVMVVKKISQRRAKQALASMHGIYLSKEEVVLAGALAQRLGITLQIARTELD